MNSNIAYRAADAMADFNSLRFGAMVLGCAALAIAGCEIWLSHSAAHTLATGTTASLLAIIAAAAALGKTFWVSCVTLFWRKRLYAGIAAAVLFGIIVHVYSIQAVLSLAATGRDATVSERGHVIGNRERVAEQYETAKRTVAALAGQRAAAEVANDLRAAEADLEAAKRSQSSAESQALAQLSTGVGPRYNEAVADGKAAAAKISTLENRIRTLTNEKKASIQAEQAGVQMRELGARLEGMGAPGHKDPQAAVIQDYLGLVGINATERGVGLGTLLPILVIVEFGGMLLMTLATQLWVAGSPVYAAAKPSGGVAVLTRQPMPPMLPPVAPSPEEKAFKALSRVIVLEKSGKIEASGRTLADHLEVPNATLATYLNKWEEERRIVRTRVGDKWAISLPVLERAAAKASARREMVAA